MEKLYSWSVVRSGASMTLFHSCGKLTGCVRVEHDPKAKAVIATMNNGKRFILA